MAHLHSIYDTDKHFKIDPITRNITSESPKMTLMQYDHNSERFTFEIPRFIEGHDMSISDTVRIHYINIGPTSTDRQPGVYEVDDVQISPDSDDVVIFSWLISRNCTQFNGTLNFAIRFNCVTNEELDYSWGTGIFAGIKVSNGLDNSEVTIYNHIDILEQWKQNIFNIIPQPTPSDAGKVLTVSDDGNAIWENVVNTEQVELTQPVTIGGTECSNVQDALEAAADALMGKIDEVDVEEVPFITASDALQHVANDTAPITPAGVKIIVDEYGGAQSINVFERLFPEPIQLTMLPNKPAYYNRIIREFSAQKQYAKYDYCYRMPDNDTYTHFYYCKVASGHLGDWSDADFTDLGRVIDPTLDPALATVNWTEYIPAAERGTLKLYANATIYKQARKYDANVREFIFNCPDQNANSWLIIKFDVDGALSGCKYQSFGFASAD